ncbi:MAG: hypothetical protein AB7V46_22270 [Thermomicrobiales bacterium]
MMKFGRKAQRRGSIYLAAWLAACIVGPTPAQGQTHSEVVVEPIHSSLPLYSFEWNDLWPRSFIDGDEFGCTSRIGFGDWRFTPAQINEQEEEGWYRFSNYGVFHCAAIMRDAGERAELVTAQWDYGFFVRLGTARQGSTEWELWALQRGVRPGSDYTLLAREANTSGLIVEFRVLQQRCPRDMIREVRGFDVWGTRYCAVESRAELRSLARRMLRFPATGTIARAPEVEREPDP